MTYQCSLINDLRGGDHHKRTVILAGVPHDGRCLESASEIERLRYVLGGVRDAIMTGRNEPLVIWKEQIDIALGGNLTRRAAVDEIQRLGEEITEQEGGSV